MINQQLKTYLMIPLKKIKNTMNELYESVDMNKLYFKYEGATKDVYFNEYHDSKEFFNEIKNQRVNFHDALKKQKNG